MLKDKELTSLHDSLFAKFKNYALSKEEMRQVRGGKPVYYASCGGHSTHQAAGGDNRCDDPMIAKNVSYISIHGTNDVHVCFGNWDKGSEEYNNLVAMVGHDPC